MTKLTTIITSFTLGLCWTWTVTVVSSESLVCPRVLQEISCEKVKCNSELTKDNCPADTIFMPKFALCGCCPMCVRFQRPEDDEDCAVNGTDVTWTPDPDCLEEHCPVKINQCLQFLTCNPTSKRCELPQWNWVPNATEECMFRKVLHRIDSKSWNPHCDANGLSSCKRCDEVTYLHHWDPDCDEDGSFSPKQCKGTLYDGECFCVDRTGNRLFGREWRLSAENQTCACSRQVSILRSQGLISTLHCTSDGNYEPLQCDTDTGVCYCVDPQTGEMDGAVVPQSQWKSLPCFSLNLTNWEEDGKYLRKCESVYAAGKELDIYGKQHGTTLTPYSEICDYDGSYAPVQIVGGTVSQCVFKNNTRIKDYFMPTEKNMTCNCARDVNEYYPEQQRSHSLACQQRTGNYDIAYDFGSCSSCVDKDGFLYGDVVPSKYFCCLLSEGCSESTKKSCYDPQTGDGYKPCSFWRFRN